MAKVKTTAKFKILELIDGFVDNSTANSLGKTIVAEAKENISQGLSPVRGFGRFITYAESYKKAIKHGIPGATGKRVRPVNLELTGEMLDGYGHRISSKKDTIEVGMFSGSAFAKEKAEYHQKGNGNMPARPIVPEENEEWSVSIMRKIRDVYSARLAFLIRQSNKKE